MNDVEVASCADDNTPFFVSDGLNHVILKLQNASKTLFMTHWFNDTLKHTDLMRIKWKLTQISVILFVPVAEKQSSW